MCGDVHERRAHAHEVGNKGLWDRSTSLGVGGNAAPEKFQNLYIKIEFFRLSRHNFRNLALSFPFGFYFSAPKAIWL